MALDITVNTIFNGSAPTGGSFPLMAFANPTAPARAEVERLARERWHTRPDWWIEGRTPKTLIANAAELPTGYSYNAGNNTVTVSGNAGDLDGWDFAATGTVFLFSNGCVIDTISNCTFAPPAVPKSGRIDYIESGAASVAVFEFGINNTTTIARLTRCWFKEAPGYADGPFTGTAVMNHGTSDNSSYPFITLMEFCSFEAFGQDGIKGSFGGEWRYLYFDPATNIPQDATEWNNSTVYDRGDIVFSAASGYQIKLCMANGTVGTAPNFASATSSNAVWQALDPHSDPYQSGQSPPSGVEIYGCFFNADQGKRRYASRGRMRGYASNGLRKNIYGTNPRQGDTHFHHNICPLEIESNFSGGRPLSFTATTAAMHPGRTLLIEDNWFDSNSNQIAGASGTEYTIRNNQSGYTWWGAATLSGVSASQSGGAVTYGFTASRSGWGTIILSSSATPMSAVEILAAQQGTAGVAAKFEIDALANTAASRTHGVALPSGTYYAHMLYQAGGGIDTLANVQTVTV
jgi:hypothetical protein